MIQRSIVRFVFASLLLAAAAASAQDATTGAIVGLVRDSSGGALPGVTVDVTSPSLIGPEHLGGLLSTAGRLVFAGAPGDYVVAYDPVTGRQLWHAGLTTLMGNTPITYMLNGKQQLVVAAGDTLYAFALQ
jgi:glucose dehydrogenase